MIDWLMVGANALWIIGLAMLLAGASYRSYHGLALAGGWYIAPGMLLVALGLALTIRNWIGWGLLLVTLAAALLSVRR